MSHSADSYYDLLGVAATASAEEIKRAYRQQAKVWHPDQNPSEEANARFAALNEAYQVLSDPVRRRAYDLRREMLRPPREPRPRPREPRPWTPPPAAWQHPPGPEEEPLRNDKAQTEFTEAYFRAKANQRRRRREEYGTYRRPLRGIALALLVFCVLLGVDYLLRAPKGPYRIREVAATVHHGTGMTRVATLQGSVVLAGEMLALLEPGDTLTLWRTPLFNIDVQVRIGLQWDVQRRRRMPRLAQKLNLPALNAPFHPRPGIFNLFSPVWFLTAFLAVVTLLIPSRLPERIFQSGLLMSFVGLLTVFLTVIS